MKTDALISMLARGDAGVAPGAVERRLAATVAAALTMAVIAVLAALGPRHDIAAAAQLPMFWTKLVVPLALAALSFAAVRRLASPGGSTRSGGRARRGAAGPAVDARRPRHRLAARRSAPGSHPRQQRAAVRRLDRPLVVADTRGAVHRPAQPGPDSPSRRRRGCRCACRRRRRCGLRVALQRDGASVPGDLVRPWRGGPRRARRAARAALAALVLAPSVWSAGIAHPHAAAVTRVRPRATDRAARGRPGAARSALHGRPGRGRGRSRRA